MVVLFDSSIYTFLKVSPGDYRHFVPTFMHQFLPKREQARIFEHYSIQGFAMITESGFKSLLQIIISNLELKHFLPRWTGITQACQLNVKYGGIPYSEDSAAWLSTIMFYAALPFLLHLLLNTVAYGLSRPKSRRKLQEEEVAEIKAAANKHVALFRARRAPRRTLARWARSVASDFLAKDAENSFFWFSRKVTVGNRARLLNMAVGTAAIEDADAVTEDVFMHDPCFWQQPVRWGNYFVRRRGKGSVLKGLGLYFDAMQWKIGLFLRLTFGIWDEGLTENMQIKYRSSRFGVANEAGFDTKHESMLVTTGEAHSLVWLFFPFCAFVSKAGER